MAETRIEYVTHTWSPVTGCSPVSEGCQNCWAKRFSQRLRGRCGYPEDNPFRVTLHPERLDEPLRWRKPKRVFTGSMTDLFHDEVPDKFLDRIFAVIALCPQHTFLILTKRPERMRLYLTNAARPFAIQKAIDEIGIDLAGASITKEEWRAIPGYEGFYEVSNQGRVRRVGGSTKGRRNPEGILRPRATRGGYQSVCLSLGAQVRQVRINRLVLEAFTGPPPFPDAEARHLNGDPTDNRIVNLCWGSKKDNMADASRHGTAGVWMKGRAKFTPDQVAEIRDLRAKGMKLDDIAARYNTSRKHISAICLGRKYRPPALRWPLPNVWLGVTAENQARADERIPILLQIPAAVRWVSCEPLLGPVNLNPWISRWELCDHTSPSGKLLYRCRVCGRETPIPDKTCRLIQGDMQCEKRWQSPISWVVVGGETGPGARPMHPDWLRSLRDQCQAAGVAFFFKSWGDWWPSHPVYGDTDRIERYEDLHPNFRCEAATELTLENNGAMPGGIKGPERWSHYQPRPELNPWRMLRVGKKAAGRLLDGRERNEMPARVSDYHA